MSLPDIWEFASILAKLAIYAGFAGAAGLMIAKAAFPALLSSLENRIRRQALILAILALAASVLSFLLRGAALTGDYTGMSDPEMLGLLWQTPVGSVLLWRLGAAGLLVAGLAWPGFGGWIALCGGGLGLWTLTLIGHVPELDLTGARLLLMLHLAGIAFWIGILAPLHTLSRQPGQLHNAALLGHRFGQAAMVAVPLLILAGLLMAWKLVGGLSALVSTGYGQTLLVKLGLVAALLALAAVNKLRLVPAMQAGKAEAGRRLARSIEVEGVLMAAILAATAVITSVATLPA
ncbi:copper resistance D family protein [Leisingera sp. ANG-Vp]|uniref:copper resistance D family protein n=1 Tax=Leisingera sp. ANG-Vp TaxID=1577896 RepID=UPI00057DD3A6|nr:CopD family protein [Leisingera sp. ANG-Vp]KIC14825.1 copper-binding protein [Leisingera sp. ANG-Vp]